ncbi:uncharacterized protein UHOD_11676 [Ustilago sp. UG-2017b]|nr:uncharacterized protein UHOD_11676 [Ustilago sp. UG-2017b]
MQVHIGTAANRDDKSFTRRAMDATCFGREAHSNVQTAFNGCYLLDTSIKVRQSDLHHVHRVARCYSEPPRRKPSWREAEAELRAVNSACLKDRLQPSHSVPVEEKNSPA